MKIIQTYNNYIKENISNSFADDIILFIKKLLPEENNLIIRKDDDNYLSIEYIPEFKLWNDHIINFYYYDDMYILQDEVYQYNEKFKSLSEYKEFIQYMFNTYYDSYLDYCVISQLYLIPVINKDYSDFIYNVLLKNSKLISQINDIKRYLNKETLDKLEHLINASKFNLI